MSEFFQFLSKNWQLSSVFFILLIVYIVFEIGEKAQGSSSVSPEQLTTLMNNENAVVLDIRTKEKYANGHIVGALSIPTPEIEGSIKKLKKHMKKPVVVVCNTGRSAKDVAKTLRENGFENVLVLNGGIAAWQKVELPLKKG